MIERAERYFQKTDPHLHGHHGFKRLTTWLAQRDWFKQATLSHSFVETVVDGALSSLWRWAYVHASDGDVSDLSGGDVAVIMGLPEDDGDALLRALIETGFVIENDGSRLINKWETWGGAYFVGERRAADAERQRRRRDRLREEPPKPDSPPNRHAVSRGVTECHDKSKSKRKRKNLRESDDSQLPVESVDNFFDTLWKAYPRKTDREPARQQVMKRLKEGHKRTEMINASDHYGQACKGKEPQYIKHGKTFFGPSKPFLDWVIAIPPGEGAGSPQGPHKQDDTIRCWVCRRIVTPDEMETAIWLERQGWRHDDCKPTRRPPGNDDPQPLGGVLGSVLDGLKPKEGA
jgi:hypothetical protein